MDTIECKYCNKQMEKGATFCPHCKSIHLKNFIKWTFIALLCIAMFKYCQKDKTEADIVQDNIRDKYDTIGMKILCENYFKDEIAIYKGSTLHTTMGVRGVFERKDDIKFVIDGTAVNEYGAERKIVVACYVKKGHQAKDYNKYSNITLFENFVD